MHAQTSSCAIFKDFIMTSKRRENSAHPPGHDRNRGMSTQALGTSAFIIVSEHMNPDDEVLVKSTSELRTSLTMTKVKVCDLRDGIYDR